MTFSLISGLARHLLTTAGGYFVAKGYIDATSVADVVGAVMVLLGTGWSAVDKVVKEKK